jgi:U4/U6 small nuclear ribonucleoprotein PRP3
MSKFSINSFTHPQKKFKVETNANQLGLTGAAIISSRFNVVIVEGGPKSIRTYKKLMLRRIKWTDSENEHENANLSDNETMHIDAASNQQQPPPNRCVLVWEGQTRGRTFKSFRFRRCPTEGTAKEFLSHHRADHYWDIARNIKEEDLLADSNQHNT